MENRNDKVILDSDSFFSFVNAKFSEVASEATIEELAEFAFGSLEEAIEAFKDSDS